MIAFIGFSSSRMPSVADAAVPIDDLSEFLIDWLVGQILLDILAPVRDRLRNPARAAGATREGVPGYLRRLFVLFLIGLAHLLCFGIGDIVALLRADGRGPACYFAGLATRRCCVAVLLWVIPIAWSAAIHFGGFRPAEPIYQVGVDMIVSTRLDVAKVPLPMLGRHRFLPHLAWPSRRDIHSPR